ncbi:MFS transporter [Streptomyces rimosus]|uniref:MFS transporter n=1 Tax=Streptomyces rimosus TaxID=1927 RepID=UPI0037D20741
MKSNSISPPLEPEAKNNDRLSRDHMVLLVSDFILRFVGIACFTIFIAGIYTVTQRTSSVGLISLATVGPSFLVLLFSGIYTRFLSPLGTIRWLLGIRGIAFLSTVPLAESPAALFAVAALQSLVHQASVSAKMVLDAEYLTDGNRVSFNAKKTLLKNIATITGPAIGGASVAYFGMGPSLVVMASLSLLVALLVSLVQKPPAHQSDAPDEGGVSALSSLRHLKGIPEIAAIVAVYCMVSVILEVQAPLMFPFVDEVYERGSDYAGLLLGLCGVGGIAGALLAQRFPHRFTEATLGWLVVVDGVVFFTFTQIQQTVLAALACILLGIMGAVTLVIVEGAVQRSVEAQHRPFTFSLMQFAGGAGGASIGVGMAFLADTYGARSVLGSSALAEILMGILAAAVWRYSIHHRKEGQP